MNPRETGKLGERLALQYLINKGYVVLATNYRVGRLGEIDIIASLDGRISFIEVKTRTSNTYGTPAEAVSFRKQRTIRQVAACFLKARNAMEQHVQFDVIEVMVTREGRLLNIQVLQEAF